MLGFKTSNYDLGVIPKMVYMFGTVFKDMAIPRLDTDGVSLKQLIKVPIIYAAKDKALERLRGDPTLDRKSAVTLPLMSFEHIDSYYDGDRKLGAMQKIIVKDSDKGLHKSQYTAVPYTFVFNLHCYAANALDLNNMIEQILPFFTPEYTLTVDLIPRMGKKWDIPIVYKGYAINDGNNGQDQVTIADRRMLFTTLRFEVLGWLFGPVVTHPVIKFANVNFIIPQGNNSIEDAIGHDRPNDRVTVQPGLTANGEPTTNAAASVPITEIEADDDFGYITTIYGILGVTDPEGGE